MIRRYCDVCDKQIDQSYTGTSTLGREHTFRLPGGGIKRLQVTVTAALVGPVDLGDVCRDCVMDAVMTLDTRPQAPEEPT